MFHFAFSLTNPYVQSSFWLEFFNYTVWPRLCPAAHAGFTNVLPQDSFSVSNEHMGQILCRYFFVSLESVSDEIGSHVQGFIRLSYVWGLCVNNEQISLRK